MQWAFAVVAAEQFGVPADIDLGFTDEIKVITNWPAGLDEVMPNPTNLEFLRDEATHRNLFGVNRHRPFQGTLN